MDKNIILSSPAYEKWAPVIGRIFFGILFLVGAYFKIPGTHSFSEEAAMTATAGVPLSHIAVPLAFVLELISGAALVVGWKTKIIAATLAFYTAILTIIFHFHFSDPSEIGQFISHLGLIGGLLYISVYGTQ